MTKTMKLLLAAATLIALTATAQADIVCTRMGCWETVPRVTIALAGGPRCNAARRRGTRRSLSPAGQDLPERLQAGSGRRAQRYPLRPFSIVSAYPPTAKLSIDGSPARSRPSLVLGEFSSAASELTVMTMMPQARIVQIIGCSRFGATPIIWTLESTLEARDGDPWGWLVSEAE